MRAAQGRIVDRLAAHGAIAEWAATAIASAGASAVCNVQNSCNECQQRNVCSNGLWSRIPSALSCVWLGKTGSAALRVARMPGTLTQFLSCCLLLALPF